MTGEGLPPIIGKSLAIRRAVELLRKYARSKLPLLLVGATGTGKELFALHAHHASGRAGRFVPVNCGALPRDMTESLLFGHRRGAFSGAVESHRGHLERANAGTIFLDELLELPADVQVKLLRALESGEVQPVGDEELRIVDVRVVAAVQDEVPARLEDGAFRRDLYERLAGVVIRLPPLADRLGDVMPLATHFAERHGQRLAPGAESVLLNYRWPGNVRELRKVIERAGVLVEDGVLSPSVIVESLRLGAPGPPTHRRVSYRKPPLPGTDGLRSVCEQNGWEATRIAATLGLARSTFYWRLKRAGLSLRDLRQVGRPTESIGRLLD